MASGIYDRFKANLMNKEVDLEADTIKVALMNNSHSFTTIHNTWSQVSANEITGTEYTANGKDIAGTKSVTQGTTTVWDTDENLSWGSAENPASFTAYHAVLYDDDLAGNDLICSFDFGGGKEVANGVFTIIWSEDGIISLATAS